MILNYIKIAIRVFSRNKLISFINLLGLSIGIAAFAIIIFYVDYEYKYEIFQPNNKRIYRICGDKEFVGTPPALGRLIERDFPEVEFVTRIARSNWFGKVTIKANGNYFYEDRFYLADSTFFQTFDYKLIYGDRKEVLDNAFSVVLSKKIALKYFSKVDAIGESIEFKSKTYIVTGIAENVPLNSHFHFDIIAPFRGSRDDMYSDLSEYWGRHNYFTYVRFKENISIEGFQDKLVRYASEKYRDYIEEDYFKGLYFQPIQKVHTEIIRGNIEKTSDRKYLLIYIFVAIIILLVASINFINISIASSLSRAKEVGLRKVSGACRSKIQNQFIGESIFFTLISLALSFVFIESFIPLLNSWLDIYISINYFDTRFILLCLSVLIWVGIIAGSYPSFVVSKLQPIKVLKSGFKGNKANTSLRNILMIVQFIISICLIISAVLINNQMKYIKERNLGFNRQGIVNIPLYKNSLKNSSKFIKNAYASNPNILSISANSFNIEGRFYHQTIRYEKGTEVKQDMAWLTFADEDFFKTYDIKIVAGTTFQTPDKENSTRFYIINKIASQKYFGDENPIGKRLDMFSSEHMGIVIGVIDDINFRSLHYSIEPFIITTNQRAYNFISLKIGHEKYISTIMEIENKWKELYPNYPFEVQFIDSDYKKLYKSENQTASLILVFTILSVIISCMGLFGINSLITKYRIREISVRKVFGASVSQIVFILSSNVLKLVLIATIIACPLAFYLMNNWLNNFAYRVQMHWSIFVFAGFVTLLLSLLTVCSQSIKTANENPVETLKFE